MGMSRRSVGRLDRPDQTDLLKFSEIVLNIDKRLFGFDCVVRGNPIRQFLSGAAFLEETPQTSSNWIECVDRIKVAHSPANRHYDRFPGNVAGNDRRMADVTNLYRLFAPGHGFSLLNL
jgi:hypothetical protein